MLDWISVVYSPSSIAIVVHILILEKQIENRVVYIMVLHVHVWVIVIFGCSHPKAFSDFV